MQKINQSYTSVCIALLLVDNVSMAFCNPYVNMPAHSHIYATSFYLTSRPMLQNQYSIPSHLLLMSNSKILSMGYIYKLHYYITHVSGLLLILLCGAAAHPNHTKTIYLMSGRAVISCPITQG